MHRLINKRRGDEGFTLIELLVVVVIIGILVAIAIPVYLSYRTGASNKAAQSDVRGAVAAVEQFYTSNSNIYPTAVEKTGGGVLNLDGTTDVPVNLSAGTDLRLVGGGNTGIYTICARNSGGDKSYRYSNSGTNAGSVQELAATAYSTCS